jgi:hypothetical protein
MAVAVILPIERLISCLVNETFGKTARTAPERDTRAEYFLLTTQLTDIPGSCPASIAGAQATQSVPQHRARSTIR